jgi:N-ethylmaleimide reductase
MAYPKLFSECDLGSLTLPNRVVMAPMTRLRAPGSIPTSLMAEYYAQRASAGLIVTECTMASDTSAAYIDAPGIYSDALITPWRKVVDSVHEAGGRIYLQLWHCGRVAHSSLMPDGQKPLAPSAVRGEGELHTFDGKKRVSEPRALLEPEIFGLTKAFGKAAARAKNAGFDGVEIHGAFGYLIDQFLQTGSNRRTDEYGGSTENRMRFLLGVVTAVQQSFGQNVGVKLSPSSRFHGMHDDDPEGLFADVLKALTECDLAYVHMMEPQPQDLEVGVTIKDVLEFSRQHYDGTIIANGGFDAAKAERALESQGADIVSFGQPFLANPDLVARMKSDLDLAQPDFSTIYGGPGSDPAKGYTDYPRAE